MKESSGMAEILEELKDRASENTTFGHYGFKIDEYEKIIEDMLIAFIKAENNTDVADKFFPKLSGEDRMKIFAFASAFDKFNKILKRR